MFLRFFFFNDTATTEIYTLSLHDALPILAHEGVSEVAFDEREEPLHIPDVPGLIQAELFADPLADLRRHVRVGRELTERIARGEREDRVDNKTDYEQRRDGDQ